MPLLIECATCNFVHQEIREKSSDTLIEAVSCIFYRTDAHRLEKSTECYNNEAISDRKGRNNTQ